MPVFIGEDGGLTVDWGVSLTPEGSYRACYQQEPPKEATTKNKRNRNENLLARGQTGHPGTRNPRG